MTLVLLVEDNEMLQDVVSARLELRGYQVDVVSNGAEALTYLESKQPDVVLMDMSLPFMNGWDATERIKQNEATKHIPVIALTAHALSSDRKRSFEVGCDEYETKPIKFERLVEKINRLVVQ
jgi:two-component system, cell cycle response regulator DivK